MSGKNRWGVEGAPNPKDPPLEALPGMALAVAPIEKGLEAGAAPAKMHISAEAKKGDSGTVTRKEGENGDVESVRERKKEVGDRRGTIWQHEYKG